MSYQKSLNSRITTLRKAEGTVKEQLGMASREVLTYLLFDDNPHDIGMLNRLLEALTPVNRRAMVAFCQHFLPYKYDKDLGRFGKLNKAKLKVCEEFVQSFLHVKNNDLWSWADQHLKVEQKPADLYGDVRRAVSKALKGSEKRNAKALGQTAIISAVLEAGVEIDALIEALELAGAVVSEEREEPEVAEAA